MAVSGSPERDGWREVTAVVPAAGAGTRLGRAGPKALTPFLGGTLLSRVLGALEPSVDDLVLVIAPGGGPAFTAELDRAGWSRPARLVVQPEPSGSADAVARGLAGASGARCIVAWADQVGASGATVAAVARRLRHGDPAVVPVADVERPYVWLVPDAHGRVVAVGRARDGDRPPVLGRADLGIFGLDRAEALRAIAGTWPAGAGAGRERDFVYVLPVLAGTCGLAVVPVADPSQTLAVNTPEELRRAENELAVRS